MAELSLEEREVVLGLSPLEKLAALSRGVRVPRSAVREVRAVSQPFAELRGWRAPGAAWPRRVAVGTWRRRGTKPDFVAIRQGLEAVVIELDDRSPRHGRLLVSVADAEETKQRLTSP